MKNSKVLLSVLLLFAICITLCGCSSGGETTTDIIQTQTATSAVESQEEIDVSSVNSVVSRAEDESSQGAKVTGTTSKPNSVNSTASSQNPSSIVSAPSQIKDHYTEDTELGVGKKTVYVKVVDNNKKTITFTIHTDEEILGNVLETYKIVKGENGPYGLYISHVNGLRAMYEKDNAYWGFYKNGEYMMTGVDSTKFKDGETYELVYVKA